jgi:phosphoenolpyruvate-protein phosphotransferase (PTS system enzyme I)
VSKILSLLRGIAVSSGIARGTAVVLACADRAAGPLRRVEASQVEAELARFEVALDKTERDLLALKRSVEERIGSSESDIFTAQALLVRDPSFHEKVRAAVREQRVNAEAALSEVVERYTKAFDTLADSYFRERAADVRDVGRRVLGALLQERGPECGEVPEGSIVVAGELLPSVTAHLELRQVRGLVTERGGKFSHSSILARSMGIPAVAGITEAPRVIKTGDQIIVDGVSGVVFVNPEPRVESEYARLDRDFRAYKDGLQQLVGLPSVTADGTSIVLLANVNKFPDTEAAVLYQAEGVGLYRTEFGFSVRPEFPTEDEQYEFLKRAAERLHPRPVTLRLLDVGGDKQLPYFSLPPSRNPSLSERGARLLLKHPEVLKAQLRAFLRVSGDHPVSILVPVVGGVEEIRRVRALIAEVMTELSSEGKRFDPRVPVGAMIEIPSAALIVETMAEEVDFFSLGTNDLVQYLLAADREDESPVPYYDPLHPAVVRLIRSVAEAASRTGRPLTICGEMAGEPRYTELLLGLGLRRFSVSPGEILGVKRAIRAANLGAANALAQRALAMRSVAEIRALLSAPRNEVNNQGPGLPGLGLAAVRDAARAGDSPAR